MEIIPETQESIVRRKRSVTDTNGVEKKKQFLESQCISSFDDTPATPKSPAVVSKKTAVVYLTNKLKGLRSSKSFRDNRKFLNEICKFDTSGRLSGLGPLEWFLTLNFFEFSKLMAICFKRNCARVNLTSAEIPTSIRQCLQSTKWGSAAEIEKEAVTIIAKGRNRFLRTDGLESAMIQPDH